MRNFFKYELIVKLTLFFAAIFVPEFAFATESQPISFSPPPSDVSVTFLSNVFGVVDGVLYGGGSQIMGSMFSMFNAAVLSLGGMILIYTTIVATINTAGEGQVLGKNWNSIWIPIRTTLGISLLFTYASGYSVLQVFVMWIVVQGVGAGDLIWNAALGYLQRGGVIVQPLRVSNPPSETINPNVIYGASAILTGVSCMDALQTQLETMRTAYLALAQQQKPPCYGLPDSGGSSDQQNMAVLCNYPVPDFINSVNIMAAQVQAETSTVCESTSCPVPALPMPNFEATSPYVGLNGICGSIQWNLMNTVATGSAVQTLGLSTDEAAEMFNSRAIAVQQMYSDLSLVAQSITDNDLTLYATDGSCAPGGSGLCYFYGTSYTATSPLGVPANEAGSFNPACTTQGSSACVEWVSPKSNYAPLLNGMELQGAVSDYNTIMAPTVNAILNASSIASTTSFIDNAEAQGWMMAGSYFYNLEKVNASDQSTGQPTDANSGLNGSTYPANLTASDFCKNTNSPSGSATNILCTWYGAGNSNNTSGQETYGAQIVTLIAGPAGKETSAPAQPAYSTSEWPSVYTGQNNATVYGYADNASNVAVAGQQGLVPPDFVLTPFQLPNNSPLQMNKNACSGGYYVIPGMICEAVVNDTIIPILNFFIMLAMKLFTLVIKIVVGIPLAAISLLFKKAMLYMYTNTVNPIIGLAQMGNLFVNGCMTIWLGMAVASGLMAIYPLTLGPIVILLIIVGPLVLSWLGLLWTMGIALAYYIPLLPYVIFTFGSFGWLIGVVEAMVAAPIVALGVTLPEGGHDVFGKGVESLMLILGAFLRPSMMIIGYVAGIILATVGIWIINTGFQYFQTSYLEDSGITAPWTTLFANFFLFSTYITLCIGIVERSFEMIYKLPDGVLRWIGGGMQDAFGAGVVGDISKKVEAGAEKGGGALQAGATAKREFPKKGKGPGGGISGSSGGGGLHVGIDT